MRYYKTERDTLLQPRGVVDVRGCTVQVRAWASESRGAGPTTTRLLVPASAAFVLVGSFPLDTLVTVVITLTKNLADLINTPPPPLSQQLGNRSGRYTVFSVLDPEGAELLRLSTDTRQAAEEWMEAIEQAASGGQEAPQRRGHGRWAEVGGRGRGPAGGGRLAGAGSAGWRCVLQATLPWAPHSATLYCATHRTATWRASRPAGRLAARRASLWRRPGPWRHCGHRLWSRSGARPRLQCAPPPQLAHL